jgi:hypothetical protein
MAQYCFNQKSTIKAADLMVEYFLEPEIWASGVILLVALSCGRKVAIEFDTTVVWRCGQLQDPSKGLDSGKFWKIRA